MNHAALRRDVLRHLWPMRRSPYIRHLIRSTLVDCRALETRHARQP